MEPSRDKGGGGALKYLQQKKGTRGGFSLGFITSAEC
jgi:hypothetical protein